MAYVQLSECERSQIEILVSQGYRQSEVARMLGRNPGTISREIGRNSSTHPDIGYRAEFAQHRSEARRSQASTRYRIEKCPSLEMFIIEHLRKRWSPELIAITLARQSLLPLVSHECIYQYIQRHPEFRGYLLILSKRRYKKRGSTREILKNRRWIDERSSHIDKREEIGHWEGDTIVSSCRKRALSTYVERVSGFLLSGKMEDRSARALLQSSLSLFSSLTPSEKLTCTLDNGSEFALHKELEKGSQMMIYFAHPYHSWERAINENTNRLLRQFFPKGTDFSEIEEWELAYAVELINTRPRKRLSYLTPKEVFLKSRVVALRC